MFIVIIDYAHLQFIRISKRFTRRSDVDVTSVFKWKVSRLFGGLIRAVSCDK